jgi:NAD-dependent deacetylase
MEAWELDVLDRAAECLARARYAIALTGAGLSVESGIPPFRGPGGLWTKHGEPPLDGYQRFLRDPRRPGRSA